MVALETGVFESQAPGVTKIRNVVAVLEQKTLVNVGCLLRYIKERLSQEKWAPCITNMIKFMKYRKRGGGVHEHKTLVNVGRLLQCDKKNSALSLCGGSCMILKD